MGHIEGQKMASRIANRLATKKEDAKMEMKKEAMAKALEYGMNFRRSTLYLIMKMHRVLICLISIF